MKEEELKPCPFCGTNRVRKDDSSGADLILCDQCEIAFSCNSFDDGVLERQWNRRESPWIDFRERRPEDGQRVSLFHDDALTTAFYDGKFFEVDMYGEDYNLLVHPEDCEYLLWQPLPAPPADDEVRQAMEPIKRAGISDLVTHVDATNWEPPDDYPYDANNPEPQELMEGHGTKEA